MNRADPDIQHAVRGLGPWTDDGVGAVRRSVVRS
jgi:hypothetical protein